MAQNVKIPKGTLESTNEVVSVEGMEAFFDENAAEAAAALVDTGLTMKQAVHFYNLAPKLIRAKIKNGEIPAVRLELAGKRKWRVYPGGVPEMYANLVKDLSADMVADDMPTGFFDEDPDLLPEWTEEVLPERIQVVTESYLDMAQANRELLDRVKELESRLEAAAYRNGYLESQLESTQEKLRCLTLRNQETHWWSGLSRFFKV